MPVHTRPGLQDRLPRATMIPTAKFEPDATHWSTIVVVARVPEPPDRHRGLIRMEDMSLPVLVYTNETPARRSARPSHSDQGYAASTRNAHKTESTAPGG